MKNPQSVKLLNNLLEYLHDSENGYQECKTAVNDKKMSELFNSLANKRKVMAQELAEKIEALAEKATESGTLAGAAHRLFVNLKSVLTNGDVDAIVNEIKRGENTLIQQYKEVLREETSEDIHLLLTTHLEEIQKDVVEIDQLSTVKID